MARIVFTLAEWRSVAQELRGPHRSLAPAGLHERLNALVRQSPHGWQEQPFALELDDSSIEAVWSAHAALTQCDPFARDHDAGVTEASRIIYHHQQEPGNPSPHEKERS